MMSERREEAKKIINGMAYLVMNDYGRLTQGLLDELSEQDTKIVEDAKTIADLQADNKKLKSIIDSPNDSLSYEF